MLNLLRKFFLVKEIKSKNGDVHFRRYRLLATPWGSVYIHNILKSDEDKDPHDHPWDYTSVILSGSYKEILVREPNYDIPLPCQYYQGDVIERNAEDAHKLIINSPVWTLVFVSKPKRVWGYQTSNGWVDYKTYRLNKINGVFND